MPRRGGRGRGKPNRPPQVLRNSLLEHGGASASFESLAKAAAAKNVTASRSFYPPLDPTKERAAFVLSEKERTLIEMALTVRSAIHASPAAVQYTPTRTLTKVEQDLQRLKKYFKTATADLDVEQPPAASLWDVDKSFLVMDLIPAELIPPSHRPKPKAWKKARTDAGNGTTPSNTNGSTNPRQTMPLPAPSPPNAPQETANDDDDDADDAENVEQIAEQNNFEDDDMELDADYQTGVRFDDDDGYDDPDSGAEEATF